MTSTVPRPGPTGNPLDMPALRPPPGDVPMDNLFAVGLPFLILSYVITTALIFARMYTKMFVIKKHTVDDYLCFASWIIYCVFGACASAVTYHRGGHHQWNIRVRDMLNIAFWLNAASICYCLTALTIKISILTQFRNIFVPMKKSDFIFWSTWALSAICFIYYLVNAFFIIFLCRPRAKAWNPRLPGECYDHGTIHISIGYFNVITDTLILFMPQHVIWKLQLPSRKRLAVGSVFAVGILACGSSIARLYYSYELEETSDVSYVSLQFGLWTIAELTFGFICACLPVMPRFIRKISPTLSIYKSLVSLISRFTPSSRSRTPKDSENFNALTKSNESFGSSYRNHNAADRKISGGTDQLRLNDTAKHYPDFDHNGNKITRTIEIQVNRPST